MKVISLIYDVKRHAKMSDVQRHFCLLLLILLSTTRGEYRSINGIKTYDFNVQRLFSNIIDSYDYKSVIECSAICLSMENCGSFFHNTIENKCVTHSVSFQNLTISSTSGWKYYQVNSDENCDPRQGYSQNRRLNICYKFTKEERSYMDLQSHKTQCSHEGAELIKITSSEIQNHIAEYLDQFHTPLTSIQGSDAAINHLWTFDDGTELVYNNWALNEPNNGFDSDYLYLKQSEGYTWVAMPDLFYFQDLIGGFICSKKN